MALISPAVWTYFIVAALHISVIQQSGYHDHASACDIAVCTATFSTKVLTEFTTSYVPAFIRQLAANMTASQQLDVELLAFLSTVEDNRSPEWYQSALIIILGRMEVVTQE